MEFEQQVKALSELVEPWAVKQVRGVKGKFTSGEYVEHKLRKIFGPNAWSFVIQAGPDIVTVSGTIAYAKATGRLTCTFANGDVVIQDAVGVWPLKATDANNGGTLEATAAERYETVLKAACTDALKAAAERVGSCFRPLTDANLLGYLNAQNQRRQKVDPDTGEVKEEEPKAKAETTKPASTAGDGNGKSKPAAQPVSSVDPSSTGFWTLANALIEQGKMKKSYPVGAVTRNTTDKVTNWPAAIAELQKIADGANGANG